jgi:ubiquinone/menaquinone biosynthesis C-methylase UbiE
VKILEKKVLDLGCGEGFRTHCLSKKSDVIGVDLSPDSLAIARERYPSVDFRVMNAERLDCPWEP